MGGRPPAATITLVSPPPKTAPKTLPTATHQATPKTSVVPQGRTRRLLHLGRAVGELAAGAVGEGLSRLSRGEKAPWSELLLTPSNAARLAERLSTLRGAAMKFGQLMSMDGQGVLPPAFAEQLARLRDRAHVMPATQLAELLHREYGDDWHRRFRRLGFEPIASASIGQVHRAETHEGRVLALKIQHPGVRESIDSDVANLALLARTPGLVPSGIDINPLLQRLREQLRHETDYAAEAQAIALYQQRLGDDPVLYVPPVVAEHCTASILATEFAPGEPIDRVTHAPQAQRDHVALALSRLAVRELFGMQMVQTDPNFANYLFDAPSGRIALLDFGAAESVSATRVEHLRTLARALRDDDAASLAAAAEAAGFIAPEDDPAQVQGILGMMRMAGEPMRQPGPYDFGASDLFARMFAAGQAQYFNEGFSRAPPAELMFLQRKFIGTFLLCTRLRARVDVAAIFEEWL